MASRRTKSIGTKVTAEEYAPIQTLAGEQPVSEWVRAALVKAADPARADSIVLAELLALRTILLNLHFHLCSGLCQVDGHSARSSLDGRPRSELSQHRSPPATHRRNAFSACDG